MIYVFRKGLGKWKMVLWPVLLSLALSSVVMVRRSSQLTSAAVVNGYGISIKEYNNRLNELREQITQLRAYARSSGVPVDTFLQLYGLNDPMKTALDMAVHDKVVQGLFDDLGVILHQDVVSKELLKSLPGNVMGADGRIDIDAYRTYLRSQRVHVVDFENKKEEEIRHRLFDEFIRNATYLSLPTQKGRGEEVTIRKKFAVLKVAFDRVLARERKKGFDEEEKKEYYAQHKDAYRIPEKRDFEYWVLSPRAFEADVALEKADIMAFYEKHRSTLYRIAPKVKVRSLQFGLDEETKAREVYEKVTTNPDTFASFGGHLSDFFSRGAHEDSFDKAVFRLKEIGQISSLIETANGYEIVQLIDRVAAQERAFDEVHDEVEATLRSRRALELVRSQLEALRRDPAVSGHVKDKLLSKAGSSLLVESATQEQADATSGQGLVIQHGFQLKTIGAYTFFMHENNYVLVSFAKREASRVPGYEAVAFEVERDCYAERARREVTNLTKQIHARLLKKEPIEVVAKDTDAVLIKSDFLGSKDSDTEPFKSVPGLLKKAFALSSSDLVLQERRQNDSFVVQLLETKRGNEQDDEESRPFQAVVADYDQNSYELSRAFVASLLRSAKIEVNQKVFGANTDVE